MSERLREAFDKWYDSFPDEVEYLDGMYAAFAAGALAAQPETNGEALDVVQARLDEAMEGGDAR